MQMGSVKARVVQEKNLSQRVFPCAFAVDVDIRVIWMIFDG
jgi:hypothetical protein